MPVNVEKISETIAGIVAAVPYTVNMPLLDAADLAVFYGTADTLAVIGMHYSVTLDPGSDYSDFIITFTPAFVTLLAGTPADVYRLLPYTTDMAEADAFSRRKIATSFARVVMMIQQIALRLGTAAALDVYVQTTAPVGAIAPNALWFKPQ